MQERPLLRSERHPIVVHERVRLLLDRVRVESVHVRAARLFVQRPRSVLQRFRVPKWDVHLPARHPRLPLSRHSRNHEELGVAGPRLARFCSY